MAEDKKIIHEVDVRIHLSIDNAKLNGRDILDIPLKELLNMMPSTQKVCGNCIHFKPYTKCSENDVGHIDTGRCTLWLRNELDSVNRLNNKLPHDIDEPACEHYFLKKEV